MKKTEDDKAADTISVEDANRMAKLLVRINNVTDGLERRLDALSETVSGMKGDAMRMSEAVSEAVRCWMFDMFVDLTDALVEYGDFEEPPEYDASGVSVKLERLIRIRFAEDLDLQKSALKALESAFYSMDYPPQIIRFALDDDGVTEDAHDLFELLVREEKPNTPADGGRRSKPVVEEPLKEKEYGRFVVKWYEAFAVISDVKHGKKPYRLRCAKAAFRAAMELIKDYATGTGQTRKGNGKWRGAFQKGRGDAHRFYLDQVFKRPRWSSEKRRYLTAQYDGHWRLWTDDEMYLPKAKRLKNYMKAHPNGPASGPQP